MRESKPTVILGINPTHNTSAAILVDDTIVAAVSEERFSRVKNHIGLPIKSVQYCLKEARITTKDITSVVVAGKDESPYYISILRDAKLSASKEIITFDRAFRFFRYEFLHRIIKIFPKLGFLDYYLSVFINRVVGSLVRAEYQKLLSQMCSIDPVKISFVGHHNAHMATGYFGSGFVKEGKTVLSFTLDGGGDGYSATVWKNISINSKLIAKTLMHKSIGYLYLYTTFYLGLKPVEDEYKVMGLAPYASSEKVQELYLKLCQFIRVNRSNLTFEGPINTNVFHLYLTKLYKSNRFDVISGAIQKLLEEKIVEWVSAAIFKYKATRVTTGGGVFANVKVNQRILQIKGVKKAFFAPSPGDESNAIGACWWEYTRIYKKRVNPISTLYLGPSASSEDINTSIVQARSLGFKVSGHKDINKKIANLLAGGNLVARFAGRMEFGARALGNRSILADASRLEVKDEINKMIKSRDFWMPFAPTVLFESRDKYFINAKGADSPFMMVTFETTPLGRRDLAAAVHPYDKTARVQLLKQKDSPLYYDLLLKFSKLTGRFGVLNTSFNLHGEPIVCTPQDALLTFKKSGLKYMQIENHLFSKK